MPDESMELPQELTNVSVSGMNKEEQQQLELQKKDIKTDVDQILRTYSKLHTMNYEDFSNSLMKSLANISHNVRQSQFESIRSIMIKNKYKAVAENQKVPSNPYLDGLKSSEEGIKNLIAVITWQKIAMEVMFAGWDKLMSLIDENKNIQHDKIKSDLDKERGDNMLNQYREMNTAQVKQQKEISDAQLKQQREMYESAAIREREMFMKQFSVMQEVLKQVKEVNREGDERFVLIEKQLSELKSQLTTIAPSPRTEPVPQARREIISPPNETDQQNNEYVNDPFPDVSDDDLRRAGKEVKEKLKDLTS